jgi:hypothetical protein
MITTEIPGFTPEDNVTGCCPKFHPGKWEEKIFDFSAYRFIKGHSNSFMYMPLNLNKVMTKIQGDIVAAKAAYDDRYLILSQDISSFKCEHHFLVKGPVKGYKLETIDGLYFCKVYDGPFKEITTWMKDFDEVLRLKGRTLKEIFAFYTTCPECAKAYGHNYVVLLAKVDPNFEP